MKKWVLICGLLLCSGAMKVQAQGCSVCTKTAADMGQGAAKGLNNGIVYLAALPLSILGVIGFFWWRNQRVRGDETA